MQALIRLLRSYFYDSVRRLLGGPLLLFSIWGPLGRPLRPYSGPRAPEVPERLDSSGACLAMLHASFSIRLLQGDIRAYFKTLSEAMFKEFSGASTALILLERPYFGEKGSTFLRKQWHLIVKLFFR